MKMSTQNIAFSQCQMYNAYITQLYSMSIQPVNKAVEHLINSTPVLEKVKEKQSVLIL